MAIGSYFEALRVNTSMNIHATKILSYEIFVRSY